MAGSRAEELMWRTGSLAVACTLSAVPRSLQTVDSDRDRPGCGGCAALAALGVCVCDGACRAGENHTATLPPFAAARPCAAPPFAPPPPLYLQQQQCDPHAGSGDCNSRLASIQREQRREQKPAISANRRAGSDSDRIRVKPARDAGCTVAGTVRFDSMMREQKGREVGRRPAAGAAVRA